MAVEYDLVIIGSTPEGIHASLMAAHLKARVALVEQPSKGQLDGSEAIYNRTFSHFANLFQQCDRAIQFGIFQSETSINIQLSQIQSWAKEVNLILAEQSSFAILAALGVDIIEGSGEFVRLPNQAFVINNRRLRSRSYIIATGSQPIIPNIEGLSDVGYLTCADFWQQDNLKFLPDQLVIFGEISLSIELVQNLKKLNKEITLVIETQQIFPQEEPEINQLIQAQLEAEGIRVLTDSLITQVRQIDNKKWLQAGKKAIETDEIILVTRYQQNLDGLNLESVGVKFDKNSIRVNEKLQTTNPQIYSLSSLSRNHQSSHIVQYEARIAVKNALFFPLFKINYQSLPDVLFTNPPIARIGITEAQAKEQYKNDIIILNNYFKTVPQAQILGETTGLFKLITRRNGQILGARIIGYEAEELIGVIAIAMQQKIKVGKLAKFPLPSLTISEIINQVVISWQQQNFQQNKLLQKSLETLLTWRRNWSS